MSVVATIAEVTLRGLLGRRRTILLLLLAALPVLVGLLARIGGGRLDAAPILDGMIIRLVLPLTALVFGTAALGAELDDGTAVYILLKPVPRWQIVVAKVAVAGLLSAALAIGSSLLTGVLAGGAGPTSIGTTLGVAFATGIAAFAYAALFVAASAITSRALVFGLIYTLIWEGVLAGILEATKIVSVREATLGLASSLAPKDSGIPSGLDPSQAILLLGLILVGGTFVASVRLAGFEVRGTE
jgi:ABC-2 type transport system permease protein